MIEPRQQCCGNNPQTAGTLSQFFFYYVLFFVFLCFLNRILLLDGAAAPKHFNLKIFVLNNIIGNDLIYSKVNGINDNYYYYLEVVGNDMIEILYLN